MLLKLLKSLPSICACVRQLECAEDELSEYVRIASVREWIISKTSLVDASKSPEKLWLCNCRTDVTSQFYFRALRRVVDTLSYKVSVDVVYNVLSMGSHKQMLVICVFY